MATKTKPISEQILHVKTSTVALVLLAVVNAVILGPGSWLVSNWMNTYRKDQAAIQVRVYDLEKSFDRLSAELHGDYLEKTDYQQDWEVLEDRLSDADRKISDVLMMVVSGNK